MENSSTLLFGIRLGKKSTAVSVPSAIQKPMSSFCAIVSSLQPVLITFGMLLFFIFSYFIFLFFLFILTFLFFLFILTFFLFFLSYIFFFAFFFFSFFFLLSSSYLVFSFLLISFFFFFAFFLSLFTLHSNSEASGILRLATTALRPGRYLWAPRLICERTTTPPIPESRKSCQHPKWDRSWPNRLEQRRIWSAAPSHRRDWSASSRRRSVLSLASPTLLLVAHMEVVEATSRLVDLDVHFCSIFPVVVFV